MAENRFEMSRLNLETDDVLLNTARTMLYWFPLESMSTDPVNQKRAAGIVLLLNILTEMLVSSASTERLVPLFREYLEALIFSVEPGLEHQINGTALRILHNRFVISRDKTRRGLVKKFKKNGLSEADLPKQLTLAVNEIVLKAMQSQLAQFEEMRTSLTKLKNSSTMPASAKAPNWRSEAVIELQRGLVLVISTRDETLSGVDMRVSKERKDALVTIINVLLSVTLMGCKFTRQNVTLIAAELESVAASYAQEKLEPARIKKLITSALKFLDPNQV